MIRGAHALVSSGGLSQLALAREKKMRKIVIKKTLKNDNFGDL